jgi:hypothetical protein
MFFFLASNSLLFPSAGLNISGSDFAPVEVLQGAQRYDWCQTIYDGLKIKADKFRRDHCKKAAILTVQGYVLFFMVSFFIFCWCPNLYKIYLFLIFRALLEGTLSEHLQQLPILISLNFVLGKI